MGSMDNPSSWAPYDSYRDCSQEICSIYCPQWCYLMYPPPPPALPSDDSTSNFSPLIIAVIGILASAFLLVTFYSIIAKYLRRRTDQNPIREIESNHNQMNHDQRQVSATGLDESLIRSITICKYKKGDGLVAGTECSVCLGEFEEDERLRLLPKCSHAFHLPCIDTWLKSHSSCPLCRSTVVSTMPNSSTLIISPLQFHRPSDLILVVDDGEGSHREEVIDDRVPKNTFEATGEMGSSRGGHALVANILQISE